MHRNWDSISEERDLSRSRSTKKNVTVKRYLSQSQILVPQILRLRKFHEWTGHESTETPSGVKATWEG